jgi:hypothetical protein
VTSCRHDASEAFVRCASPGMKCWHSSSLDSAVPPTRWHAVETAMLIAAPCPRQQIYIEHRITSAFQGL